MIPEDLKYTKDHEWVRVAGNTAVVGVTHHAQDQLGDVVFVELPEVGKLVAQGDAFGSVESVKAVSDLFAPVSGTVTEVNGDLGGQPDTVNTDPYGAAWMIKLELSSPTELDGLMDAAAYRAALG